MTESEYVKTIKEAAECRAEFVGMKEAFGKEGVQCLRHWEAIKTNLSPWTVIALCQAWLEREDERKRANELRDIDKWINDVTINDRVEAGIANAKSRGGKIKNGSTTEESIRTAFTEIVRDAMK